MDIHCFLCSFSTAVLVERACRCRPRECELPSLDRPSAPSHTEGAGRMVLICSWHSPFPATARRGVFPPVRSCSSLAATAAAEHPQMANITQALTTRPEIDGTFGRRCPRRMDRTAVGMGCWSGGGNAFDARGDGLHLQVVEPHLCGPGGDVPAMLYDTKAASPIVVMRQGVRRRGRPSPLSRPPRPRHRPRYRPTAPAAGHVRDLMMICATRHAAPARRAGAGHRLRPQRLSPGGAPLLHHRYRRELFREHGPTSAAIYLPAARCRPPISSSPTSSTRDLQRILREAEPAARAGKGDQRARRAWSQGFVAEAIDGLLPQTTR